MSTKITPPILSICVSNIYATGVGFYEVSSTALCGRGLLFCAPTNVELN